ncbi:MAG: GtrA family protein [Nocardioides sp.]|uniref:GtrA family protein n=1 Tax=Nocardioides sp. TaxID=35761 RepID=UPI0039E304EB
MRGVPRAPQAHPSLVRQAVAYGMTGGLNTLITLALYRGAYAAWGARIGYVGAILVASAIGIVTGYFLNGHLAFGVRDAEAGSFVRYASVASTGVAFNTVVLPLLVEVGRLEPWPAQLVATVLVFGFSLVAHRFFSFRRAP